MEHQPPERALRRPALRHRLEPLLPRFLADNLDVDSVLGALFDGAALVGAVDPCLHHARMASSQLVHHVAATDGVLHTCRGHQHHQQQPQGVERDVSLPTFDLFRRVDSLRGLGNIARSLHRLRIHRRRGRRLGTSRRLADPAAQRIMNRLGGPVGFPLGVVVVHRLVRRKIMRQILPRNPGPIHIQHRIDDLAQLMTRLLDIQTNPLRPPHR